MHSAFIRGMHIDVCDGAVRLVAHEHHGVSVLRCVLFDAIRALVRTGPQPSCFGRGRHFMRVQRAARGDIERCERIEQREAAGELGGARVRCELGDCAAADGARAELERLAVADGLVASERQEQPVRRLFQLAVARVAMVGVRHESVVLNSRRERKG